MLIFGLAFVISLNVAARLDRPEATIEGIPISELRFELLQFPPGADRPVRRELAVTDAEDEIFARNLENLRNWSLISVVGLAFAAGVGGYVLSGIMLRPVRDITEVASQITATNLSRRINHEGPDDELKALADTFDSMIDRIETSFEQQRQFVQDASHELRTPLAAIRTNIEVAEMDSDLGVEDYRILLETVKTQTERLTRLTEDLLLLSTSEGDRQEPEPVDLRSLAQEVVLQLGPLASQKGVGLEVAGQAGIEALASADQLYRCVFNLVDNAIKYSGNGATVIVRAEQAGAMAQVSVEDNGAGIAADKLPNLFDRFFRVDKGRSRREGGTGLGLAIVKELVHNMGGTVTAESTVGLGTTFRIRLEVAPPEPVQAPTAARRPALTM